MPDVSGVYSLPPGYKAVTGETIQPSQHNPPLEDIAAALSRRLSRDGSAPMTGNLAMNGNRVTGLAAGTATGDAARVGQVVLRDGSSGPFTVEAGTEAAPSIQWTNENNGIYWIPGTGPRFTALGTTIGALNSGTALPDAFSIVTREAGDARYMQNLIGGDGITVTGGTPATRTAAVNATVLRTTGAQTITGAKTFTGNASFDSAAGTVFFESDGTGRNTAAWRNEGVSRVVAVMKVDNKLSFDTFSGGGLQVNGTDIVTTLTGGAGMSSITNTGSGRTVAMGTPGSVTRTSTNSASGSTHTHSLGQTDFRDMVANYTAAGGLGSYLMASVDSGAPIQLGDVVPGSNIRPAGERGASSSRAGFTMQGSWRCMGYAGDNETITLYLRVS